MRKLGATLVTMVALAILLVAAAPAQAATVVDVQSYVNAAGNTVTIEATYVDGVLAGISVREVMPDGTLKYAKTTTYYPSGALKSSDEYRNFTYSASHIYREYSETGVLLFQRGELSILGETTVVSIYTYDTQGYLLTHEERRLTTLADGTQVWIVTVSTYSDGTLVSETVTQYPYGYVFDAPPAADDPGDDDGQSNVRPGWGYGDKNHEHSGPPGKNRDDDTGSRGGSGSQSASSGGSAGNGGTTNGAIGSGQVDERPGQGKGDPNHEHTGARGKK